MTWPSDPPLPPNRTLCCSHTPASPPMHTTSLLVLQKSEPITTYAKPMALIPPFVPTSCMQMGSTQPHYILTRCRNNWTLNFKIQISMPQDSLCPTIHLIGTILHGFSFPQPIGNVATILRGLLLHAQGLLPYWAMVIDTPVTWTHPIGSMCRRMI